MAERILEIRFSGTWNQPKNGFMSGRTRRFFIILPNFLPYFDDFSKFSSIFCYVPLWKIINYGKILAKNEENPCSTCLQPISPKCEFRVPIPPLLVSLILKHLFSAIITNFFKTHFFLSSITHLNFFFGSWYMYHQETYWHLGEFCKVEKGHKVILEKASTKFFVFFFIWIFNNYLVTHMK